METSNIFASVLNIIGSIASLAAIPLSVFLYLRSQEAKAGSLRRDIVRILSHQIGEGRLLSVFEIQAVIQSKAREHGLKGLFIPHDVIIEDLVTDTITNPMLESERKQQIVDNMRTLHANSEIYRLIEKYQIKPSLLAKFISSEMELQVEDKLLIEKPKEEEAMLSAEKRSKYFETFSSMFAIIATLITLISFAFTETTLKKFIDSIVTNYRPYLEILIGTFGSIIAALILIFISKGKEIIRRKKELGVREKDKKN